nr:single-stranded DNA-binding protein [uncultured Acetatifactor sp.]
MSEKMMENNRVQVMGEIVSRLSYSHETYGERFYMMDISVCRTSGTKDYIPIMVSERLMDVTGDHIGKLICVEGQFRSYNRHEERKNRLVLSVFAREAGFLDGTGMEGGGETNQVFLDGYICKEPTYRKTPLGREIADVLLAVNRPYGKSDYIPCICWGRNARLASRLNVGDEVMAVGRIQSRGYMKKLSETEAEERVAYEVSVSMMETVRCAGE